MLGLSKRSVSVFELVNERRREIYVGRTSRLIFAGAGVEPHAPVPELAHWDPADVRPPRHIEGDLSEHDAERFIAAYVNTPLPKGWRFLT